MTEERGLIGYRSASNPYVPAAAVNRLAVSSSISPKTVSRSAHNRVRYAG